MKYFFLIISVFYISIASAQTFSSGSGTVLVIKDPRFDVLSEKQADVNNRAAKYSGTGIRSGYRIQVVTTQNRDEANAVRTEMLRRFPDQKAYLQYQSPNFRVRIGNFLTQKDAKEIRSMIAILYPQRGIYIIPDRIEYRPQMDEDDY